MMGGAGGFCKGWMVIFVLAGPGFIGDGRFAWLQDRATLESDLSGSRVRRLSLPMLPLGAFLP